MSSGTITINRVSGNVVISSTVISGTVSTALTTARGIPSGGTTGQVLAKNSNTSYDVKWSSSGGGGGSSVSVNGALVTDPNFNGTTPAAPASHQNITFQVSGDSVSAYIPDPLKGDPGVDGKDGIDGINGTNGVDGVDGTNGTDGGTSASVLIVDLTAEVTVGNSKAAFTIPSHLNGKKLTAVHARVITAGTTNASTFQVQVNGTNMLSTAISIDSTETGSDTAATPYVIDTDHDDVATNDLIEFDVLTVSTTPPKGLIIRVEFGA